MKWYKNHPPKAERVGEFESAKPTHSEHSLLIKEIMTLPLIFLGEGHLVQFPCISS